MTSIYLQHFPIILLRIWRSALAVFLVSPSLVSGTHQEPSVAAASFFEVASVRRVRSGESPPGFVKIRNGTLTIRNYSLKQIIRTAYGVQTFQILGPQWLNSENYDIVAKADGEVNDEKASLMLQGLLADRFALRTHRDHKDMEVYELVLVDTALVPPQAGDEQTRLSTMADIAAILSNYADRPVLDRTGLKGRRDISLRLHFAPPDPNDKTPMRQILFEGFLDAIRKAGLKLTRTRTSVDVLVVDSVSASPSEN